MRSSFAETPSSKDSYETTDMNEKIEKAYSVALTAVVLAILIAANFLGALVKIN